MTALTQQLVSVVIEADSVLFQLYTGGDMQLWCGKYQWDDRTGSDADQDVQGEAFNKNSWSDGKKTVSFNTELVDLNDTVAERRRQSRTFPGNVAKPSSESDAEQHEKNRRRARALLVVSHGSRHVDLISDAIP